MITKILNPWIYVLKNKDFKNAVKGHCNERKLRLKLMYILLILLSMFESLTLKGDVMDVI